MPKKKLNGREKVSIEDIYRNKHFVPPKEQNLETIFEEPRQSKDGAQILTSVKKYKRYLHFDPSQNKIQKRKRKAKKCITKFKPKLNYITRSSPENSKTSDISLYIMQALGDTSSDGDMDQSITKSGDQQQSGATDSANSNKDASCLDFFDTPKKRGKRRKSFQLKSEDIVNVGDTNEHQGDGTNISDSIDVEQTNIVNKDDEAAESPRRSCCLS